MKILKIVQAVLLVVIVAMMASCSPSRDYRQSGYPSSQPNFSLVISSLPGHVLLRDPYGAYYYRDSRGYIYRRGYDNRYYLDSRYMNRSYYGHQQYNDWKRYHNNGRRRR